MKKHLLIFTLFACASSYILAPVEEESREVKTAQKKLSDALTEHHDAKLQFESAKTKEIEAINQLATDKSEIKIRARITATQDRISAETRFVQARAKLEKANNTLETARQADANSLSSHDEITHIKSSFENLNQAQPTDLRTKRLNLTELTQALQEKTERISIMKDYIKAHPNDLDQDNQNAQLAKAEKEKDDLEKIITSDQQKSPKSIEKTIKKLEETQPKKKGYWARLFEEWFSSPAKGAAQPQQTNIKR